MTARARPSPSATPASSRSCSTTPSPTARAALWELLRWADIVIENEAPGVLARHGFGPDDVLAARPAMVYVSITGYGQTGPRRDWRITELTIGAAGGMVDLNGADDREPLAYPGHVMGIWSGAAAAAGALAAWRHARRTGIGQHVDVSMQEAIASTLFLYYADYEYTGAIQPRGQRELLEASDGDLYLRWVGSPEWDEFAIAMDTLELATRPELGPPDGQALHFDEIMRLLGETVQAKPREHWRDVAMEHGFLDRPPAAPRRGLRLLASRRARLLRRAPPRIGPATCAFPGIPYTVDRDRPAPAPHGPARRPAQRRSLRRAPHGRRPRPQPAIRSRRREPGPPSTACASSTTASSRPARCPARILADLGAEVIRVENYLKPDVVRGAPQPDGEAAAGYWERGGIHHEQHRNKRYGVGLDITTAEGRDAFLRLAAGCDVVLDNHPYDVFERLGPQLGSAPRGQPRPRLRQHLRLRRDRAVPSHARPGHGPRAGHPQLVQRLSRREVRAAATRPSSTTSSRITSPSSSWRGSSAATALGAGAWIDVAQYEVGANLAGDLLLSEAAGHPVERRGSGYPGHLLDECFPGAGRDRWLAVSIPDRAALDRVAALLGASGATASVPPTTLRPHLAAWSRARDPLDAATQLQADRCPRLAGQQRPRPPARRSSARARLLLAHRPRPRPGARRRARLARFRRASHRRTGSARLPRPHARRAQPPPRHPPDGLHGIGVRGVGGPRRLRQRASSPPARSRRSRIWRPVPSSAPGRYPWRAREMDPHYHERLRERFGRFGASGRRS